MSRRFFLRDLGHGAVVLAAFSLVGCSRGAPSPSSASVGTFIPRTLVTPDPESLRMLTYDDNLDELESFWCSTTAPESEASHPDPATALRWARFGTGVSSGYILLRGGEATLVDTGQWCVPDAIEGGLAALGLAWSAIGSVIVTHKHPDHWIGLPTALERATDAVLYAGSADIPFIATPRPIVAVGAGDRVMDLAIIPTPGHTPGHIAVHDEVGGVLVVGDAITGTRGHLEVLPTSEDRPQAQASLTILAGLPFDTLLPGHGLPIIGGAWEELTQYVAGS